MEFCRCDQPAAPEKICVHCRSRLCPWHNTSEEDTYVDKEGVRRSVLNVVCFPSCESSFGKPEPRVHMHVNPVGKA